jgi:hypothetical protein
VSGEVTAFICNGVGLSSCEIEAVVGDVNEHQEPKQDNDREHPTFRHVVASYVEWCTGSRSPRLAHAAAATIHFQQRLD